MMAYLLYKISGKSNEVFKFRIIMHFFNSVTNYSFTYDAGFHIEHKLVNKKKWWYSRHGHFYCKDIKFVIFFFSGIPLSGYVFCSLKVEQYLTLEKNENWNCRNSFFWYLFIYKASPVRKTKIISYLLYTFMLPLCNIILSHPPARDTIITLSGWWTFFCGKRIWYRCSALIYKWKNCKTSLASCTTVVSTENTIVVGVHFFNHSRGDIRQWKRSLIIES